MSEASLAGHLQQVTQALRAQDAVHVLDPDGVSEPTEGGSPHGGGGVEADSIQSKDQMSKHI